MAGLNQTPAGERTHIAFFGKRNVGKSSLVNAFTGQDLAIVSDVKGTTTDPVYKSMELLPLGPVEIIDTPGIDDVGKLGALRVKKTRQVLNKTDLAVVVVDAKDGLAPTDKEILSLIKEKKIPCVIALNKTDLLESYPETKTTENGTEIYVSAKEKKNITELKELCARLAKEVQSERHLISDLIKPLDTVLLVIPIDKAAPKGRLILPQQQVIRDILEAGANALVCRDTELEKTLEKIRPVLVVTDSQVFGKVAKIVPEDIPMTSFSILMARYKGDLDTQLRGVDALKHLPENPKILIAEGCTHHRQCEDIGTVKIPRWIEERTGLKPDYTFTAGTEYPEDLSPFDLIIHCGACMLRDREVAHRIAQAKKQGTPITNYGMFIADQNKILDRALKPLK